MTTSERTVPAGAIMTALAMTEALSDRDGGIPPAEYVAQLDEAVQLWGHDVINEAFLLLIGVSMNYLNSAEVTNDPDAGDPHKPYPIRVIVPAILGRLRRLQLDEVPETALPTVAGVLTAAALDQNPYEWRTGLGPMPVSEGLVWCYVTWLLVDFIDNVVHEQPGLFTKILTESLGLDDEDDINDVS